MQDQKRVVIDYVSPSVNCGEFYIKRVVNEIVNIGSHIMADGHDVLGASVAKSAKGHRIIRIIIKKCFIVFSFRFLIVI